MPDYSCVIRRVHALNSLHTKFERLGSAAGWPIYGITLSKNDMLPKIMILGGIHGDEPAGVEACLAFCDLNHQNWLNTLQFHIIPCLNPYGYVHNTRNNDQDIDINWAFSSKNLPEIQALCKFVNNQEYETIISLHEDWESHGYYMYEYRKDATTIGQNILKRVAEVCPINLDREIDGVSATNGLVDELDLEKRAKIRGLGIPIALFQDHTTRFVTTETPTSLNMTCRIEAQVTAIQAMIENHISLKL